MKTLNFISDNLRRSLLKVTLLGLFILMNSLSYAQDKPTATPASSPAGEKKFATTGVFEIGGNASYSSVSNVDNGVAEPTSFSIFNISPRIGYFVSNGLEIGLNTGATFLPYDYLGGVSIIKYGGSTTTFIQFFGTLAYNFITKGESIYPFLEGQIGYTSISESGSSTTLSGLGYGFKGGIKVIATTHFLLDFAGQYSAITTNAPNDTNRNGYNYFSISVGVAGYF